MSDQQSKVSGYRRLSQAEIELMNEGKALGGAMPAVHREAGLP